MIGGVVVTPGAAKLLAKTAGLPARSWARTSRLLPLALRPFSTPLGTARLHWLGLALSRLAISALPLITTVMAKPASRPVAVPLRVIGLASGLAAADPHWPSLGVLSVNTGAAVSTWNALVVVAVLPA